MTDTNREAYKAWSLLKGSLDWSAMDSIFEYLEIKDVDAVIACLIVFDKYAQQMKDVK